MHFFTPRAVNNVASNVSASRLNFAQHDQSSRRNAAMPFIVSAVIDASVFAQAVVVLGIEPADGGPDDFRTAAPAKRAPRRTPFARRCA